MLNNNAVTNFYNHYHSKKVASPNLYVSNDTTVSVVLPTELLDYANAAAGHSGFGSGARPYGIRRTVTNAKEAIADIFSSVESLTAFIESSERNGNEYVAKVREAHYRKGLGINDNMVKDSISFIAKTYGNKIFMELAKKFGRDVVINDREVLTVNEFELRYGLSK